MQKSTKTDPQAKRELSVLQHMRDWPLERGQMLLIGPAGARMLAGEVKFRPPVPQVFVFEKAEWHTKSTPSSAKPGRKSRN